MGLAGLGRLPARLAGDLGVVLQPVEAIEAKGAAPDPACRLGHAAHFARDHFASAIHAKRSRMVALLNTDVPAPHLMGYGGRRAGAEVRIEHEITRFTGDAQDAVDERFRLRRVEQGAMAGKSSRRCFLA